jgi:hypothetical protein
MALACRRRSTCRRATRKSAWLTTSEHASGCFGPSIRIPHAGRKALRCARAAAVTRGPSSPRLRPGHRPAGASGAGAAMTGRREVRMAGSPTCGVGLRHGGRGDSGTGSAADRSPQGLDGGPRGRRATPALRPRCAGRRVGRGGSCGVRTAPASAPARLDGPRVVVAALPAGGSGTGPAMTGQREARTKPGSVPRAPPARRPRPGGGRRLGGGGGGGGDRTLRSADGTGVGAGSPGRPARRQRRSCGPDTARRAPPAPGRP